MKRLISFSRLMLVSAIVCFAAAGSRAAALEATSLTNRIEGIVWDPAHRPVPDVYVEPKMKTIRLSAKFERIPPDVSRLPGFRADITTSKS